MSILIEIIQLPMYQFKTPIQMKTKNMITLMHNENEEYNNNHAHNLQKNQTPKTKYQHLKTEIKNQKPKSKNQENNQSSPKTHIFIRVFAFKKKKKQQNTLERWS